MFKNSRAFSSFSVSDLKVAKEFYGETLGLDVTETSEGLDIALAGGGMLFLYSTGEASPAEYTVLNFPVVSVEETVEALMEKGIRMEQYDMPYLKTDAKGIVRADRGPKSIAWFKDPDGNILSVLEEK